MQHGRCELIVYVLFTVIKAAHELIYILIMYLFYEHPEYLE